MGQGVWKHLTHNADLLEKRIGVRVEVARIGEARLDRPFSVDAPRGIMTTDSFGIVDDPDIDIVCELIGGTGIARELTLRALKNGKCVVTANKALISQYGAELFQTAREHKAHYFFEASVGGGIPIIKAIREGLVINRFSLIYGILNGTCNYILTRMEREGAPFETILKDAQRLGYAEANASLDVDGFDTAHKAIILGYLATGYWMPLKDMIVDGIRDITPADIAYARELGYKIKLLGLIGRDDVSQKFFVRVHPTLLPSQNILANVDDVFNAVSVTGDAVDTTVHIGRGAGQDATASAVIADIADAARVLKGAPAILSAEDVRKKAPVAAADVNLATLSDITGRYYLRLTVEDSPGVLAQIAGVLAQHGVSVASMIQRDEPDVETASLIFTTHRADELAISRALEALKTLPCVRPGTLLLRILNRKSL